MNAPFSRKSHVSLLFGAVLVLGVLSVVAAASARGTGARPGFGDDVARLPSGLFEGPLWVEDPAGKAADPTSAATTLGHLRVHIVSGFIISAEFSSVSGDSGFQLQPRTSPDDPELRLTGRRDRAFLMLSGHFWDVRAARGRFEGVLDGRRVAGHWAARRL